MTFSRHQASLIAVIKPATSNFGSQTIERARVQTENKDIATDRIVQRNQATTCNLCAEVLSPEVESRGVQTNEGELQANRQKYFLYACKYSYDPFKSSPNDNPEAELPLAVGEYLFILNEEDEDGFFVGESLGSTRGLVPSNFVEKVSLRFSLNVELGLQKRRQILECKEMQISF